MNDAWALLGRALLRSILIAVGIGLALASLAFALLWWVAQA